MQKQKIDLNLYLVLQSGYEIIEVGLFDSSSGSLIEKTSIPKHDACKILTVSLDNILKNNNISLNEIMFLAVNQGPSPFSALRTVIATANAINFGNDLPLIGVDGIEEFIKEHSYSEHITVALLNAYNRDVYYAINYRSGSIRKGCKNIEVLLPEIKLEFPDQKIAFIGNGVDLFNNEILTLFNNYAYIHNPNPQTCSIEQIAKAANIRWKNKSDIREQLEPLYLKDAFRFKITV